MDKYVDKVPEVRTEGSTTIIPVIKEVAVVEKKLMLIEEIHITRQRDEVAVEVKDKIRKEHVVITKDDPGNPGT
jgi:stress response protein YsnF